MITHINLKNEPLFCAEGSSFLHLTRCPLRNLFLETFRDLVALRVSQNNPIKYI